MRPLRVDKLSHRLVDVLEIPYWKRALVALATFEAVAARQNQP